VKAARSSAHSEQGFSLLLTRRLTRAASDPDLQAAERPQAPVF